MNYFVTLRVFSFLFIAGLWYIGWWPLAGVLTLVYFFRYLGYEMIVLGLFLDIQFMTGHVPWYTLILLVVFIMTEWFKPRLLSYTK